MTGVSADMIASPVPATGREVSFSVGDRVLAYDSGQNLYYAQVRRYCGPRARLVRMPRACVRREQVLEVRGTPTSPRYGASHVITREDTRAAMQRCRYFVKFDGWDTEYNEYVTSDKVELADTCLPGNASRASVQQTRCSPLRRKRNGGRRSRMPRLASSPTSSMSCARAKRKARLFQLAESSIPH